MWKHFTSNPRQVVQIAPSSPQLPYDKCKENLNHVSFPVILAQRYECVNGCFVKRNINAKSLYCVDRDNKFMRYRVGASNKDTWFKMIPETSVQFTLSSGWVNSEIKANIESPGNLHNYRTLIIKKTKGWQLGVNYVCVDAVCVIIV